jgi:hypothetical protein
MIFRMRVLHYSALPVSSSRYRYIYNYLHGEQTKQKKKTEWHWIYGTLTAPSYVTEAEQTTASFEERVMSPGQLQRELSNGPWLLLNTFTSSPA